MEGTGAGDGRDGAWWQWKRQGGGRGKRCNGAGCGSVGANGEANRRKPGADKQRDGAGQACSVGLLLSLRKLGQRGNELLAESCA